MMLLILAFLILLWWFFWRNAPARPPVAPPAAPPTDTAPPVPPTMVAQMALAAEPVVLTATAAEAPALVVVAESFATSDAPAVVEMFAPQETVAEPVAPGADSALPANPLPTATAEATPADFTLIEGIGRKINELLHQAGLTTFLQLSTASPEQLRALLEAARIRGTDPTTWPAQAALAATAQWEALKAFKGGKRSG